MATSRSEGVKLKPFVGAQRLQNLIDLSLKFSVESNLGKDSISNGFRMSMPPKYIETLGLSLDLGSAGKDLVDLIDELYGKAEGFKWLVIGKDTKKGILRETSILQTGDLTALSNPIVIKDVGSTASQSPISNPFTGFELEFLVILAEEREPNPVRPHIVGSIVASASVTIIPEADFDVIIPRELTDDVRKTNNLPVDSWFFVDFSEDFLKASTFQEAMDFYVDPGVLAGVNMLPDRFSLLGESILFLAVTNSLVFQASALAQNVEEEFDWAEDAGIIPNFLMKAAGHTGTPEDFMTTLSEFPNRIATAITSRGTMKKRLTNQLENLTEEVENVPDSED